MSGAPSATILPHCAERTRRFRARLLALRAIIGIVLSAMAPTDLVAQAIEQALSGISSRLRAEARAEGGAVGRTIERRVALAELSKRVKGRLDGLRGTLIEEGVDVGEWPPEESDDEPLEVAPPSVNELRERLRDLESRSMVSTSC